MPQKREKELSFYEQYLKESDPEWYEKTYLNTTPQNNDPNVYWKAKIGPLDDDWLHRKPGELNPYEKWLKKNHPKVFAEYRKEKLNVGGRLRRPHQTRKRK